MLTTGALVVATERMWRGAGGDQRNLASSATDGKTEPIGDIRTRKSKQCSEKVERSS